MTIATDAPLSLSRQKAVYQSFARQGLLASMSARIVEISSGRCVIEIPFGDGVSQQHGFFHGGAVGAVADSAGGYAAMTLMPENEEVLTLEYKINFLRPALGSSLIAEGSVLRAGRSVTVTRADVFVRAADTRLLCAVLQQSMMRSLGRE